MRSGREDTKTKLNKGFADTVQNKNKSLPTMTEKCLIL